MSVLDGDNPGLGPCCVCERVGPQVRNVMMIDRRGPVPGKGWGCVICDLPSDGAVAVVCDECTGLDLRFVCAGYISEHKRAPYAELPAGVFAHDAAKHDADERRFVL